MMTIAHINRMRRFVPGLYDYDYGCSYDYVLLAGGIAPRDYGDAAYGVMGPIGVAWVLLESNCRA